MTDEYSCLLYESIDLSIDSLPNPLLLDRYLNAYASSCAVPLLEQELLGEYPMPFQELPSEETPAEEPQRTQQFNEPTASGLVVRIPLVHLQRKPVGTLTTAQRQAKIERYVAKRKRRVWHKKISYTCRKEVAEKRVRLKGRFITKEEAHRIQFVPSSLPHN